MIKNIKGRNWAFVVYPESLPTGWLEILEQTGLPFAISPLHDKDFNPTGEVKKPHYHVIVSYSNTTTYNNVKTNVCDLVNATIPIKLEGMKGMYRYHIHLDNPEKYQYDDRDRQFLNCFDVSSVTELTSIEIDKLKFQIQDIVDNNNIFEYSELMTFLKSNDMFEFWRIASKQTLFFDRYISSRRNKYINSQKKANKPLSIS